MSGVFVLIARRIALFVPLLLATTLLVFVLLELGGADPSFSAAGGLTVSPEARAKFRHEHGLDKPLPIRYVRFLGDLAHGDLGDSLVTGTPVRELLGTALPVTLQLTGLAMGFAALCALLFGVLAAVFRGRWIDSGIRTFSVALIAAPNFWVGMLAIDVFAVKHEWFPSGGYTPAAEGVGPWLKSLTLPALTLGLPIAGVLTRVVRTAVVEELDRDYVRTAHGAGIPPGIVIGRNVLRNALVSPLTVLGLYVGYFLAGTLLIETVFALPGIGRLIVDGVLKGDIFVVRTVTLITVSLFLLANLLVDVGYLLLNPRVRST